MEKFTFGHVTLNKTSREDPRRIGLLVTCGVPSPPCRRVADTSVWGYNGKLGDWSQVLGLNISPWRMWWVSRLLCMGELEPAVKLLVESEPEEENFLSDQHLACLISTVAASGTTGCRSPPSFRRQVEIIWTRKLSPLLPTGIGEQYSQTM